MRRPMTVRPARRNPQAKKLRAHPGRFAARVVPSGRLYRRRPKHRRDACAGSSEGWA